MNPFDLSGRVAVVTGANTGIGQAIAVALAQAGADVALVGRTPADDTAATIRGLGRRAEIVSADLSTIAPVQRVVDETVARLGGLDILVNNAGIIRRADAVDRLDRRQIGGDDLRPAAKPPNGLDRLLGGRAPDTGDVSTRRRQRDRDRLADAGIGPGDDRDAARKIEGIGHHGHAS